MGQAQSLPLQEPPAAEAAGVTGHAGIHAKKKQKENNEEKQKEKKMSITEPLEKWTNDDRYSFEVISPLSDISNPSQFRHRQSVTNNGTVPCKKDLTLKGGRVQTSRNRTSKVCSKQYPQNCKKSKVWRDDQDNTIPPPTRFYFQPETERKPRVNYTSECAERKCHEAALMQQEPAPDKNLRQQQFPEKNYFWRIRFMVLKAKCHKARKNFSECWPMIDDFGAMKHQETFDQVNSTSTDRVDEDRQKIPEPAKSTAYLQLEQTHFQPVWKEQVVAHENSNMLTEKYPKDNPEIVQKHQIRSYYLHSEDEYVNRIAVKDPNTTVKEVKLIEANDNSDMDGELTKTPVQALFDADDGLPFETYTSNKEKNSNSFVSSPMESKETHKAVVADTTVDKFQTTDLYETKQNELYTYSYDGFDPNEDPVDRQHGKSTRTVATANEKGEKVVEKEARDKALHFKSGVSQQTHCCDTGKHDRKKSLKKNESIHVSLKEEEQQELDSQGCTNDQEICIKQEMQQLRAQSYGQEMHIGETTPFASDKVNASPDEHSIVQNMSLLKETEQTKSFTDHFSREAETAPALHVLSDHHSNSLQIVASEPATEKRSNKSSSSTRGRTGRCLAQSKYTVAACEATKKTRNCNDMVERKFTHEGGTIPAKSQVIALDSIKQTKLTRRSLPYLNQRRSSSNSMASMLQQTYITAYLKNDECNDAGSCDDEQQTASTVSAPAALMSRDYREIAFNLPSSPLTYNCTANTIAGESSPALSVDSASSIPMLSDQVVSNAAFLFSPSYGGGNIATNRLAPSASLAVLDNTMFSISTLESRARVSSTISKPITIPVRLSNSSGDDSLRSDRRVRFSEATMISSSSQQEKNVYGPNKVTNAFPMIPGIETQLSDITDASEVAEKDYKSIASIDSRQSVSVLTKHDNRTREEQCKVSESSDAPRLDGNCNLPFYSDLVTDQAGLLAELSMEENLQIFEDVDDNRTPPKEIKMSWSYRTENEQSLGVTPLIGGKSHLNATNSPYLRFQAAKSKFSGRSRESFDSSKSSSAGSMMKESPVKRRSSPITKQIGALVNTRIAAMEARCTDHKLVKRDFIPKPRESFKGIYDTRPERMSMSSVHQSILTMDSLQKQAKNRSARNESQLDASDNSSVVLPASTAVIKFVSSKSMAHDLLKCEGMSRSSPTIDAMATCERSSLQPSPTNSTTTSETLETKCGQNACQSMNHITGNQDYHVSSLDEVVAGSEDMQETESDVDLFDEFLQEQDIESECYTENASVATIRQDCERNSNDNRERTNTLCSLEDASTEYSPTSSIGVASVATIRQNRDSVVSASENSAWSGVSHLQPAILSFREEAPVKPSELNNLAPFIHTQQHPVHAMKWRALAAAAHEKDAQRNVLKKSSSTSSSNSNRRASLMERNPNTIGR